MGAVLPRWQWQMPEDPFRKMGWKISPPELIPGSNGSSIPVPCMLHSRAGGPAFLPWRQLRWNSRVIQTSSRTPFVVYKGPLLTSSKTSFTIDPFVHLPKQSPRLLFYSKQYPESSNSSNPIHRQNEVLRQRRYFRPRCHRRGCSPARRPRRPPLSCSRRHDRQAGPDQVR